MITIQVNASTKYDVLVGKGLLARAGELTKQMLESTPPMDIVQGEIIPALNTVGSAFEKKTIYPSLFSKAYNSYRVFISGAKRNRTA